MKDNGDLIGLQKWMLETNNEYIESGKLQQNNKITNAIWSLINLYDI